MFDPSIYYTPSKKICETLSNIIHFLKFSNTVPNKYRITQVKCTLLLYVNCLTVTKSGMNVTS